MSIVISAFAITARGVHLAGNGTEGSTVAWVSSPNGRGTFDLLQSCLLTLILCVWTAMHLNIPPQGQPMWKLWRSYLKWSFLGIFGPEMIIYIAWMQNNSARSILNEMKNNFDIIPSENKHWKWKRGSIAEKERRFPHRPAIEWTMAHSFYAVSGGFYFENNPDSPDGGIPFLPRSYSRYIITSRGIGLLARCGYAPKITLAEIQDRDKADSVTKAIVVLQAAWFLAQVLGRVKVGMPVTLLEVNTIGHVVCVFVIYLLWWHKPRLVSEPTKLEGDWIKPMAAYMYICSRISGHRRPEVGIADIFNNNHKDREISSMAYFSPNPVLEVETKNAFTTVISTSSSETSKTDGMFNVGYFGPRPELAYGNIERDIEEGCPRRVSRTSTNLQQARWDYANEALRQHPHIYGTAAPKPWARKSIPNPSGPGDLVYLEPKPQQYLAKFVGNWDIKSLLKWEQTKIMGMFFWTSSIVFGAVHLSAWNAEFPTVVEAWMWRCSALWIEFSGLLWWMINFIGFISPDIDAFWTNAIRLRIGWYWKVVLGSLCGICGAAWVGARAFLVIEAFISIRRLPYEAYDTPDWTQVFPHL